MKAVMKLRRCHGTPFLVFISICLQAQNTDEIVGIGQIGLFTTPVLSSEIEPLRVRLNRGHPFDFSNMDYNHNIMADVMLQWLRELPEPLTTWDLFEEFMSAQCTMLPRLNTAPEEKALPKSLLLLLNAHRRFSLRGVRFVVFTCLFIAYLPQTDLKKQR